MSAVHESRSRPRQVSLTHVPWSGVHVIGPGAGAWLAEGGWMVPEANYTVAETAEYFTTRLGPREFIVASGQGGELPPAPHSAPQGVWVFPRCDAVLELDGVHWKEAAAEVCSYDFRELAAGSWLPVAMAGVTVWCLPRKQGIWIGCDPSYGAYLEETLREVVADLTG